MKNIDELIIECELLKINEDDIAMEGIGTALFVTIGLIGVAFDIRNKVKISQEKKTVSKESRGINEKFSPKDILKADEIKYKICAYDKYSKNINILFAEFKSFSNYVISISNDILNDTNLYLYFNKDESVKLQSGKNITYDSLTDEQKNQTKEYADKILLTISNYKTKITKLINNKIIEEKYVEFPANNRNDLAKLRQNILNINLEINKIEREIGDEYIDDMPFGNEIWAVINMTIQYITQQGKCVSIKLNK